MKKKYLALQFENASKRNANVYSIGITKVYTLDRTAYINLIGSISEIEEMDCTEETPVPRESTIVQQRASIASFRRVFNWKYRSDSGFVFESPIRLRIVWEVSEELLWNLPESDLEVIGSLGAGAFGFVKLVKLRGCEGKAFALKCIQKHKVVQYGQQKHILDERNILRHGSLEIVSSFQSIIWLKIWLTDLI